MQIYMDNDLVDYEYVKFPGGEPHVKLNLSFEDNLYKNASIIARLNNSEEVLKLFIVTDAIKRYFPARISVVLGYIPGGRQDRVSNVGEALSLKVYADLINSQNYTYVNTVDPHSDVTTALLKNVNVVPIADTLKELIIKEYGFDTIIIPDSGATKKMFSYYFPDTLGLNFIQCNKKRDTKTGKLSGFEVYGSIDKDAKCLITDDLCDGGGTFIGLAKEIKKQCEDISLYTTHSIYSKGMSEILTTFNNVFTMDTFHSPEKYMAMYNSYNLENKGIFKVIPLMSVE